MLFIFSRTDRIDRFADALVLVDRIDHAGRHIRIEHRLLVDAKALVPERHLSEQVILSVHIVVEEEVVIAEHSTWPKDDRLRKLFAHRQLAVVFASQKFRTFSDHMTNWRWIDVQRRNVDESRYVVLFGDLCDSSGTLHMHIIERKVSVSATMSEKMEEKLEKNSETDEQSELSIR